MNTPGFHLTIALIVPILAGDTQWVNAQLTVIDKPNCENDSMYATMKLMNIIMPLFSVYMCISLPIYMGIYWIAGSIARTLIQLFTNLYMKKYTDEELVNENIKKAKNKEGKSKLFSERFANILAETKEQKLDSINYMSIFQKANSVSLYKEKLRENSKNKCLEEN